MGRMVEGDVSTRRLLAPGSILYFPCFRHQMLDKSEPGKDLFWLVVRVPHGREGWVAGGSTVAVVCSWGSLPFYISVEQESKSEQEVVPGYETLSPFFSDPLHQARLHLLKVPQLWRMRSPAGIQVFKHMNQLWDIHIQMASGCCLFPQYALSPVPVNGVTIQPCYF